MNQFPMRAESPDDMEYVSTMSSESHNSTSQYTDEYPPPVKPDRPINNPPSEPRPESPPPENTRPLCPPGRGPRPDDPFPPPQGALRASSARDHHRHQGPDSLDSRLLVQPSRSNEYFIPKDGISREVITSDISHYLGSDARVRPGNYQNPETRIVQEGYVITAYRNLTMAMISDLKADSQGWDAESRASSHLRQGMYRSSTTHQSRQYYGPTEVQSTASTVYPTSSTNYQTASSNYPSDYSNPPSNYSSNYSSNPSYNYSSNYSSNPSTSYSNQSSIATNITSSSANVGYGSNYPGEYSNNTQPGYASSLTVSNPTSQEDTTARGTSPYYVSQPANSGFSTSPTYQSTQTSVDNYTAPPSVYYNDYGRDEGYDTSSKQSSVAKTNADRGKNSNHRDKTSSHRTRR